MRRTAHARANTKSKKSRGPFSSSEQAGNTLDRPDLCSPLMESTARKENSPTSRSPGGGEDSGFGGRAETGTGIPPLRSHPTFSSTSPAEGRRAASSRYKRSAPCDVAPYLPGRDRRAIMKARGLGQWPSLHLEGALAYHLPKWESGRHNLW